jgi:hypothetical protein
VGQVSLGQCRGNCLQDSDPVLQDVVVPEPKDLPALSMEISISLLIATIGVLSAVRVDD